MSIKVTDRRMFNQDGELREDYSYLDEEDAEEPGTKTVEPPSSEPTPSASRPVEPSTTSASSPRPGTGGHAEPAPEMPGSAGRGPEFLDLVAYLAEPIALLLGDARLPNGESAEDLEQARALIDLVELLQTKTRGNLEAQEEAILEDLLYRLKMRYVEKRKG